MSWDLYAFDLPGEVTSLRTLPADARPKSLGDRREWIERMRSLVPDLRVETSGPIVFGYYSGDDFRVQIGFGNRETIDCIAFHIYGGQGGIDFAVAVTKALGLAPFDMQSMERYSAAGAAETLNEFEQAVARYKVSRGIKT